MSKKRVLIIDDEKDFCLLLSSYFSKYGYEVALSYSLTDGMRSLEVFKPDILFLDNNLPDGMGWEAIAYIVEHRPGIELNLISAFQINRATFSGFPAIRIWEKPLNVTALNKYFAP